MVNDQIAQNGDLLESSEKWLEPWDVNTSRVVNFEIEALRLNTSLGSIGTFL